MHVFMFVLDLIMFLLEFHCFFICLFRMSMDLLFRFSMDFVMRVLDFDGFVVWISMDFLFGFCTVVPPHCL